MIVEFKDKAFNKFENLLKQVVLDIAERVSGQLISKSDKDANNVRYRYA